MKKPLSLLFLIVLLTAAVSPSRCEPLPRPKMKFAPSNSA